MMDIRTRFAAQWMGAAFLIAALGLATPASAQESERIRLYLGGSAGASKVKNGADIFPGATVTDIETEGFKAFLGIEFEPGSALEFTAISFGTFESNLLGGEEWKAQGATISYVGTAPINSYVSLLLRVGLFGWRITDEFAAAGIKLKETGVDWAWGIGSQFNFGRFVSMRLEYEQFNSAGEAGTTGMSDLELISVSLLFRL